MDWVARWCWVIRAERDGMGMVGVWWWVGLGVNEARSELRSCGDYIVSFDVYICFWL